MYESRQHFFLRSIEKTLGIPDERYKHIILAAEERRANARNKEELMASIFGFSKEDTPETIKERIAMAYFAGQQHDNPRQIVKISIDQRNREGA